MKHTHSLCGCGHAPNTHHPGRGYGHLLGENGCQRRWLKGQPVLVAGNIFTGTFEIDGHPFSAHQILTQHGQGAVQHECGCWSAVISDAPDPAHHLRGMGTAPRNGTTVLLLYQVRAYGNGSWEVSGTKWEECRWIDRHMGFPTIPCWNPWSGNSKVESSTLIQDADALAWIPVPTAPPNSKPT